MVSYHKRYFYKRIEKEIRDSLLHSTLRSHLILHRYARYGHSLDSITVNLVIQNREQEVELMILMGGFAPAPINDIWVTDDGTTWL